MHKIITVKKHFLYAIAAVAFLLTGCTQSGKVPDPIHLQGEAQGTYYSMVYYDSLNRNFHPQVDSILTAFDQSVSLWVPNSILSRVNKNDTTVVLDNHFIGNFLYSQQVSRATHGAFDMTVGPLVEVWGFGFENRKTIKKQLIDSLRNYVGYQNIKLVNGKIVKALPQMRIDFNGIAQGYSVDVVARFFQSKGIKNYLIDIGGEVTAHGQKTNHRPWRVGIEKPAPDKNAPRTVKAVIALKDQSVATSGSYRKYYIKNGIRYSHTIDPKTGYPVQHSLLSVSVLTDNTALADAYATAFMVMGYQKSRAFVEKHPGLEAFFIWSEPDGRFQSYATPGFKRLIIEDFSD